MKEEKPIVYVVDDDPSVLKALGAFAPIGRP